jgi:hypothetical protein
MYVTVVAIQAEEELERRARVRSFYDEPSPPV